MRKLALATLATVATLGVSVASGESASAALATCRDSNGSATGGSVYWGYYSGTMTCNVVPPQRLHITQTPSASACADMGGHGWTSTYRICWDVDY